jgi:septum formation topological specificity factor MinE
MNLLTILKKNILDIIKKFFNILLPLKLISYFIF